MSGNSIQIVLSVNQANFSAAMKEAQQRLDTFAGKARSMGHSTVSNTQAASAAIRIMEGDLSNLVRAAERFVGQSRVLSGALKAAFPVIGAAAIVGVIGEGISKLVKFIETANKVPQVLSEGFAAMNLSQQTTTDELTKSNHQLENQIAILQGKPVNNLALALDDSRLAADKLAESLQRDRNQVASLLKDNAVSLLGGVFTHQGRTAGTAGLANYWARDLATRSDDVTLAQHQYGVGSEQDKSAQAALAQRHQEAEASLRQRIAVLEEMQKHHVSGLRSGGSGATADQTANLVIAKGYLSNLEGEDDQQAAEKQNAQDQAQLKTIQDRNAAAAKLKEAQAKIVATWKTGLDALKAQRDLSLGDEANYWLTLAGTVKTGSDSYKAAIDEANKAMAQEQKELAPERDKWQAAGMGPNSKFTDSDGNVQFGTMKPEDLSKNDDYTRSIEEQGKATAEWLHNLHHGVAIQQANANAIAEASLKMAVAQGTMSKLDAAQVQAQLHTQEYAEQLQKLQDALAAVQSSMTLSPSEKNAQATALQNQIAQLNGARAVQIAEDNSVIDMNTVGGSIRQALDVYVQEATDAGKQISDILTNAFSSVNESLASSLMAKEPSGIQYRQNILRSLSGSARSIGTEGLDAAFKNVEGSALKAFGFGGKQKQQHVIVDNWPSGVGGVAGGGSSFSTSPVGKLVGKLFPSLFHGVSQIPGLGAAQTLPNIFGSAATAAPAAIDSSAWLSSVMGSIPGFADGGDPLVNHPAIIGENGPELWIPHSSGTIVPNDALGGTTHNWSVDARGSNDPAATEAAVNRAMAKALPHAVAASVQAVHERQARRPNRGR